MTRKRFNTVTIAAMIAILALGSLGLGYAAWSTQLNVGVTAKGGNANVDYILETTREYMSQDSSNWGSPQNITYAHCDATIVDANNLQIDVTDMFPGYRCEVDFRIKNVGTVPVEATSATVNWLSPASPDDDLDAAGYCSGVINPGGEKVCTATVWLDHADVNYQNGNTAASVTINFTQAAPAS